MPGLPTPPDSPWSANQSVEILDDLLQEIVNSENAPGTYVRLAPGTPHPNQEKYPGYIFLTQKTVNHDTVMRYWTTPGFSNQDVTNWEASYVSSSYAHPVFTRRYKTRRDQYQALQGGVAGTKLTGVWRIKLTNPGSGYDPQNPPTVTIGGTGSGATAVALVNVDGTISWIRITAEGTGYTTATVTIAAPSSGTQATATATVQDGTCYLIEQATNNFPEDDPRFALFLIETRVFQTFPGPTITKWEYQERIERYVKVDKRLILKSEVPANPNAVSLADGVTIEYQDLTAVYSAEITTTVPSDMEGEEFVYEAFMNYRFPDEVREDPKVIVAATLTDAPSFAVDYGFQCVVTEGYNGPCRARVTERYTFDPTDAAFIAALPTPTSIFPRADTIWVATNAAVGGQARADVISFVIPLSLHRTLTVTSTAFDGILPYPRSSTYDYRETIAPTVPVGFEAGDSITVVSEPQRVGIGGLWMVRIIEIFHPARA